MHIGGKFTGGGPIFEDGVGACLPRVTATSDHVIGRTTAAPRDGARPMFGDNLIAAGCSHRDDQMPCEWRRGRRRRAG